MSNRIRNFAVTILIISCIALYGNFHLAGSVGFSIPRTYELPQSATDIQSIDAQSAAAHKATTKPVTTKQEPYIGQTSVSSLLSVAKPTQAVTPDTIIHLETDYITFPAELISGSRYSLKVVPQSGTVRPYLTLLFEHSNHRESLERQFLKPFAIYPESHVEFHFTMFTSGQFRVTIFDDKVLLDEPWTWYRGYFHLGPQKAVLHQFSVTFNEPSESSTESLLSDHLATLPYCSLLDLANLQFGGRFLKPTLFPNANTSVVDTSKWIDKIGGQDVFLRFLPAKCKLHYFNVHESQDCVTNKNITFMGDSTLAESVKRLMLHLHNDYADFQCPHSTANCEARSYREGQFETTNAQSSLPSYLSLLWAPSLDVCAPLGGAYAFENPLFADWLRFRSSYPESCHNYEDKLGLSLKLDWKSPNGTWRKLPAKKQEFLFFSSGVHDLCHWAFENTNYMIGNYTKWMDQAMSELAGTAKNKIYITVSPKVGKVDTSTEFINKIARKLAAKHGYSFIEG
ncbi:hypothetical protein BCR33DRAFT_815537 [Rhizoclosmatium globosum]|uniref:Uncharacterized protein n=1 Tax=Rhizoclosmatium globosum TaxID=329046 RepID=A0A1Y2D201_9FUNG|nr:hypothetical protein BCR33DRAFT_815537 [Rhizoclosmatium globosum]|eukprot:ORY53302.1 hypothetical protein BCR33DRAFT_815537 [Rhizoclosmatium globosum]